MSHGRPRTSLPGITLVAALALATLGITACGSAGAASTATTSSEATSTSAVTKADSAILGTFSADDLDGITHDQSVLQGHRLTMVNVWATYCSPCIREMGSLGELSDDYADKGLQVIGVVSDTLNSDGSISSDQVSTAKSIVAATGADYLHLVPSSDLYPLIRTATAVPTTIFVDETGTQVGKTYTGAKSKDAWAAIIDETLAAVTS
ncbi:MAG: TlpA disulfide reductase family protein [Atopobiaceae bacterium]|jgi:thiol-disulfide isomerase/thioredoxin|nr:TlpA family protein disulfide reductase [Atopobiaceae bacterium]MCH4213538.1 TlpA family protein disulfide reductase [Atopobiaceae bacterium]MCH4229652.1 TlpA family protein disulfide reductase [Atopobiaceae bacterium]MCH4276186.1 TlpA family protein disulfide reductase [Atopobiaceae bacterium]MCI1226093.1 TlpA family protein disulfide reductase [Atopobiaceae bacterium]